MLHFIMDLFSYYWFVQNNMSRQKSMAFLEAYSNHFSKYINQEIVILEIGCGYPSENQDPGCMSMGGSLGMWRHYLKNCKVIGIDILPGCKEYQNTDENIFVEIGDQSNHAFLDYVIEKHGVPTVIIDDGSHQDKHIKATFEYLYPRIATPGTYAIEDIGGNLFNEKDNPKKFFDEDRTLRVAMNHVYQINQSYTGRSEALKKGLKSDELAASAMGFLTKSINFYPNLVIYEKGLNVPYDQMPGPPHYSLP